MSILEQTKRLIRNTQLSVDNDAYQASLQHLDQFIDDKFPGLETDTTACLLSVVDLSEHYCCSPGYDLAIKVAELEKIKATMKIMELEIKTLENDAHMKAHKCGTMLQMLTDANKMTPKNAMKNAMKI
jgi:hypothetical protein